MWLYLWFSQEQLVPSPSHILWQAPLGDPMCVAAPLLVLSEWSCWRLPLAALCFAGLPQETDIVRKLQANRASTTDMSNNTVNVGDYVTVVDTSAAAKAGAGRKEKGGEFCCSMAAVRLVCD